MFHHIKKKICTGLCKYRIYIYNRMFLMTLQVVLTNMYQYIEKKKSEHEIFCCVNIAYLVQIFKETSARCSHKFSLYIRFHYKLYTTVSLVKKTQNVRAYAWSHRINKVNRLNLSHLLSFQSEFFFLPPQHHIFVIDWST